MRGEKEKRREGRERGDKKRETCNKGGGGGGAQSLSSFRVHVIFAQVPQRNEVRNELHASHFFVKWQYTTSLVLCIGLCAHVCVVCECKRRKKEAREEKKEKKGEGECDTCRQGNAHP